MKNIIVIKLGGIAIENLNDNLYNKLMLGTLKTKK